MCGIFGIALSERSGLSTGQVRSAVDRLVRLSESRGKEAAGIAVVGDDSILVYKQATAGSTMLRTPAFQKMFRAALPSGSNVGPEKPVAVVGHSRLVTHGAQYMPENNQPVIAGGTVGLHNGIVVNHAELWRRYPGLTRRYDVDTEVLLELIRWFREETGSICESVRRAFSQLEGVANVAVLFRDLDQLLLATNNGSIYLAENEPATARIFASEEFVLRQLIRKQKLERTLGALEVSQLAAGTGCLIDLRDVRKHDFSLERPCDAELPAPELHREIVEVKAPAPKRSHFTSLAAETSPEGPPGWLMEEHERCAAGAARLRRCRKCVLPETIPFVDLDAEGVCGSCRNYRPERVLGREALAELVAPFRRSGAGPECLVPLSGGRDSCYSLHYLVAELGLRPVAYTYDWGMVTDLARRNCSRLCSKLGVEHIIVSADITRKRAYIRKNVEAWMKRPALGTIPLFMAGDKQFFYYADKLRRQNGTELVIFAMNPLERTDFKHGFCGISGGGHGEHFFRLSMIKNVQIALYYGKKYLLNPGYLNSSMVDTLFAYFSYFLMPHNYTLFYDYIEWDETPIERTLLDEYRWELARDTESTWRIGDGTASFYNYIYYTVAGFSENDTFRSGQVRQGKLTREQALKLVERDNRPRYDSIHWYCNTIGVDPDHCLRVINAIPKLYSVR